MLACLMTTYQSGFSFDGRFDPFVQRISIAFPTLAMLAFLFADCTEYILQTGMKWPPQGSYKYLVH